MGAVGAAPREVGDPLPERPRRRLSRTFSRARWDDYRTLLATARLNGYAIVTLEEWVLEPETITDPVLVLRHDVDQHPRSALRMAAIERELDLRSTWYFRWRTANRAVIAALRAEGHAIGFHYETLTRLVLRLGLAASDDLTGLVEQSRVMLRHEIAAFQHVFGSILSIAPHGDTRAPGVSNQVILRAVDTTAYGVAFDAREAMRGRPLGRWLTDRTRAEGSWSDGMDPLALLEGGTSPMLCLTHPNNWVSGPSLWADRIAAGALRDPGAGGTRLGPLIRTGTDEPLPSPLRQG